MTTLEEKINSLEEEISGYRDELKSAGSTDEKREFRCLIVSRSDTLNRLIDERNALNKGILRLLKLLKAYYELKYFIFGISSR